jgi:hypothetical protein
MKHKIPSLNFFYNSTYLYILKSFAILYLRCLYIEIDEAVERGKFLYFNIFIPIID